MKTKGSLSKKNIEKIKAYFEKKEKLDANTKQRSKTVKQLR